MKKVTEYMDEETASIWHGGADFCKLRLFTGKHEILKEIRGCKTGRHQ